MRSEDADAPLLLQTQRQSSIGESPESGGFSKKVKVLVVVVITVLALLIVLQAFAGFGSNHSDPGLVPGSTDNGESESESESESEACEWTEYRLPDWVTPNSYKLELDVEMEEPYRVSGTVEIAVTVEKSTSCVVLHGDGISVDAAKVKETGDEGVTRVGQSRQLIINFNSSLPEPSATLVLDFNYKLNDAMKGFYRAFYEDEDGKQLTFASTKFEAVDARLALPCFDEPALKATFSLTLIAPRWLVCLSNMPEESSEELRDSKTKHVFQTSPRMPTYLFAWAIGKMVSIDKDVETMDGTKPFRIWGTPKREGELRYALDMISKIVPYFESQFNVSYTLPKLDLIAVPNFKKGAMENWGMITFRETDLLLSDAHSHSEAWTHVPRVIAHETAHMWFGDLVTMEWWGDIWLNEGFAKYWNFGGAQAALPAGYYFRRLFSVLNVVGFNYDEKNYTHPLSVPEEDTVSEGSLVDLFDKIVYRKGGAILNMVHTYLTRNQPMADEVLEEQSNLTRTDPFTVGLESYLKKHLFGNTKTSDLWGIMSESTGMDFSKWMHKWSYTSGYPIVYVELEGNNVMVKQEPFGTQNCSEGQEWWIPIRFTTKNNMAEQWHILDTCGPVSLTNLVDSSDFPIVNKDRVGFYRVQYSRELMDRLLWKIPEVDSPFGGVDLTGLLSDAYHLESDYGDIERFLNLTQVLGARMENSYAPWEVALSQLFEMHKLIDLKNSECAEKLANYVTVEVTGYSVTSIVPHPTAANMSEVVDYDYGMMRDLVLYGAGLFGDDKVIQAALNAVSSGEKIDPDLRRAYYSMAVAHGDSAIYDKIESMYLSATQVHEKERLMYALGWATDPELIKRTLNSTISDRIRVQDTRNVIEYVATRNKQGAELAFEFAKDNLKAIGDKIGGWERTGGDVSELLYDICKNFASNDKYEELKKVFEQHGDVLQQNPYLYRTRDRITKNQKWLEKYADKTCNWLPA